MNIAPPTNVAYVQFGRLLLRFVAVSITDPGSFILNGSHSTITRARESALDYGLHIEAVGDTMIALPAYMLKWEKHGGTQTSNPHKTEVSQTATAHLVVNYIN